MSKLLTLLRHELQSSGVSGGTIRRVVQSGRSSFYCPDCQR